MGFAKSDMKKLFNKNLIIDYVFILIVFFLIFEDFAVYWMKLSRFAYFDEIISLISVSYYVFYSLKSKSKTNLIFIILMFFIFLIGIISNFIAFYQTNLYVISLDILSFFKYLFLFLGMYAYIKNRKRDFAYSFSILFFLMKIYVIVLLIFSIFNQFMDIGMSTEYRFGIKGFSFIFGVPGVIINHISYFIVMLLSLKNSNFRKSIFWSIIAVLILFSTLKARAFVIAGIFVFLSFFKILNKKFKLRYAFVVILISFLIGFFQFKNYFIIDTNSVRSLFLNESIQLANKYFPFGTGFSTFGTSTAAHYYSEIYYDLGFNLRYGLSPDNPLYLNDTFWPGILGELGYIGIELYLILLLFFSDRLYKLSSKQNNFMAIFVIFDFWISSIQSAYITSNSMICLIVILLISSRTLPVEDNLAYDN